MESNFEVPKLEYPLLAFLNLQQFESIETLIKRKEEIYVITIIGDAHERGCKPNWYAQKLCGGIEGYFIRDIKDYTPLPKGTKVTITQ